MYVQTEHNLKIIISSVCADIIYTLLVVYLQTENSLKIIGSVCADIT